MSVFAKYKCLLIGKLFFKNVYYIVVFFVECLFIRKCVYLGKILFIFFFCLLGILFVKGMCLLMVYRGDNVCLVKGIVFV